MEHYRRAEVLESPPELAELPFRSLPEDLIWMKVKATSRVGNMVGYVKTQLKAHDHVLWSGSGPAVCKAMMSAELLKKAVKELHQETHCCYHRSVTGGNVGNWVGRTGLEAEEGGPKRTIIASDMQSEKHNLPNMIFVKYDACVFGLY